MGDTCLINRELNGFESHNDLIAISSDQSEGDKVLRVQTLPQKLTKAENAVRGAIFTRYEELLELLKESPGKIHFNDFIALNIANPHAFGQKPISFNRQILSCLISPSLLEVQPPIYPSDVILRARKYLNDFPSFGCYSDSKGILVFRKDIAHWYSLRDGSAVDVENVFLTDGVSSAIHLLVELLIASPTDGILIPVPQYPLFTATINHVGGIPVRYYLDEPSGWALNISEVKRALDAHRNSRPNQSNQSQSISDPNQKVPNQSHNDGINEAPQEAETGPCNPRISSNESINESSSSQRVSPASHALHALHASTNATCRAMIVIDPGNPTASVLTKEKKIEILRFCEEERLVLIVDETYQDNIYDENFEFCSFRKVAHLINSRVELLTIYSSSKGLAGECGSRGGLIIADNIDEDALAILTKVVSVSLCANTLGQAMIGTLLAPPLQTDPSFEQYCFERKQIWSSFQRKAQIVFDRLSNMKGLSCHPIKAGMAVFVAIEMPPKFAEEALKRNVQPDLNYCLELLQETGVMVVPGSGFGQLPNTHHFRMTLLETEERMVTALDRIEKFNEEFRRKWMP